MDNMEHRLTKTRWGLTLIEVMVAITVIVIGILGAVMFRYSSALDARKADVQVGAGRVALLILEGWKGAGDTVDAVGNITYNPANDVGAEVLGSPDISITSNGNDNYTVQLTGGTDTSYYATLLPPTDYTNADLDGDGNVDTIGGIRKLTVEVTSGLFSVKLSDFVRTNPDPNE